MYNGDIKGWGLRLNEKYDPKMPKENDLNSSLGLLQKYRTNMKVLRLTWDCFDTWPWSDYIGGAILIQINQKILRN